jgi:hypothetical protein
MAPLQSQVAWAADLWALAIVPYLNSQFAQKCQIHLNLNFKLIQIRLIQIGPSLAQKIGNKI